MNPERSDKHGFTALAFKLEVSNTQLQRRLRLMWIHNLDKYQIFMLFIYHIQVFSVNTHKAFAD